MLLGIGKEALANIIKKIRQGADDAFESPAKRYKRLKKIDSCPDTFDTDAIKINIISNLIA
jgi:hypothetical protein